MVLMLGSLRQNNPERRQYRHRALSFWCEKYFLIYNAIAILNNVSALHFIHANKTASADSID
jgi:hypothetical protein